LAAEFDARPRQAPQSSSVAAQPSVAQISAVDTIDLRFPTDWVEPVRPAPAVLAFASADHTGALFTSSPVYAPSQADAWGAPSEAEPEPQASPQPASATAKIALASTSAKPAAPPRRSNAVLNDSQLASIKRRLNLTPEQERYWPAVEAQLRKMEYKRDASGKSTQGTRTASVDISKMDVEGLKSAGFPLVMSFNEDQRRELRSLAHLLGLENVISTF
jgi:hypothetical protein